MLCTYQEWNMYQNTVADAFKEHMDKYCGYYDVLWGDIDTVEVINFSPGKALYDCFDFLDNPVPDDPEFMEALRLACAIGTCFQVNDWIIESPWAHKIIDQLWKWGLRPNEVACQWLGCKVDEK